MTKQAIDVDELRSFPFEIPVSRGGEMRNPTTDIDRVKAYESGVDGLVLVSKADSRGCPHSHEWMVVHGPTGVEIWGADSFSKAIDMASEIHAELGAEILTITTEAGLQSRVEEWAIKLSREGREWPA